MHIAVWYMTFLFPVVFVGICTCIYISPTHFVGVLSLILPYHHRPVISSNSRAGYERTKIWMDEKQYHITKFDWHPGKLTWNLKIVGRFRWVSFTIDLFLGSMWIFRGVIKSVVVSQYLCNSLFPTTHMEKKKATTFCPWWCRIFLRRLFFQLGDLCQGTLCSCACRETCGCKGTKSVQVSSRQCTWRNGESLKVNHGFQPMVNCWFGIPVVWTINH